MKVVFMGTPDFAVPSLQQLLESTHEVAGVVTQPDRPRGRGKRVSPSPVKQVAFGHHLPLLQPEILDDPAFLKALRGWAPDLIVVVAFRILPNEVIGLPPKGVVNVHPSLLPRYRGAAPINWAIIRGETQTGVTTFLIAPKIDTGDILLQRSVPIGPDETAGGLHDRLKVIGADLLLETLDAIAAGTARPRPQPEAEASQAPKLRKADARINWSSDAASVRNLIRGTNPLPGAFTTWHGELLKIHSADIAEGPGQAPPGQIVEVSAAQGVRVATGGRVLRLKQVQPASKRPMTSAEWARGHSIKPGDTLGV